ncbi:hypothetical protein C8J57DRAFT_1227974 [Mycena rebaudengoi]|nr:hypothetical protein C8J57DRAFT_1227974 [Mycena rebaudengoi]
MSGIFHDPYNQTAPLRVFHVAPHVAVLFTPSIITTARPPPLRKPSHSPQHHSAASRTPAPAEMCTNLIRLYPPHPLRSLAVPNLPSVAPGTHSSFDTPAVIVSRTRRASYSTIDQIQATRHLHPMRPCHIYDIHHCSLRHPSTPLLHEFAAPHVARQHLPNVLAHYAPRLQISCAMPMDALRHQYDAHLPRSGLFLAPFSPRAGLWGFVSGAGFELDSVPRGGGISLGSGARTIPAKTGTAHLWTGASSGAGPAAGQARDLGPALRERMAKPSQAATGQPFLCVQQAEIARAGDTEVHPAPLMPPPDLHIDHPVSTRASTRFGAIPLAPPFRTSCFSLTRNVAATCDLKELEVDLGADLSRVESSRMSDLTRLADLNLRRLKCATWLFPGIDNGLEAVQYSKFEYIQCSLLRHVLLGLLWNIFHPGFSRSLPPFNLSVHENIFKLEFTPFISTSQCNFPSANSQISLAHL